MNSIRVAILTDIHASGTSESAESWASLETIDGINNPFYALREFIEQQDQMTADVLICCGDMANKADFSGQRYVWDEIHKLGLSLSASLVLGTAGNHDLDSRPEGPEFDPKGNLQSLVPRFPTTDDNLFDKYWSRNFSLHKHRGIFILNINSCAFHGYQKENIDEYLHGRISRQTLNGIKAELAENVHQGDVGIAMLHHHPIPIRDVTDNDYSAMKGGTEFLEILSNSRHGSWLVIHGHKHYPSIINGSGGANSPIVFSAASFSSKRLSSKSIPNQFYIVELELDSMSRHNFPLAGQVESWNWDLAAGWSKAFFNDQVPFGAGFGSRAHPHIIARQVHETRARSNKPYLDWSEVLEAHTALKYSLPDDYKAVVEELQEHLGYTRDGYPDQLNCGRPDKDDNENEYIST